MPRVVALLGAADADVQRNSAGCLANLASTTEELQQVRISLIIHSISRSHARLRCVLLHALTHMLSTHALRALKHLLLSF